MSSTNNSCRVVAIGNPGPIMQQISDALNSQSEYQLIDMIPSPERLVREISAARPDVVIVDSELDGKPTLDMIEDIALEFSEIAIIAILSVGDPIEIQRVLLAGARTFLVRPFTQINLLSALGGVRELESRRQRNHTATKAGSLEGSRPLRTLTVFSPRGGAGCSTLAVNLALAIYEETNQRVLLLEGKQFFGHIDVMLNIRTQNTLADLIPHAGHLDDSLIRDVVIGHGSGIHVLLGPNNLQVAQGIHPDDLYGVFIGLQRAYDLILIDAGSTLTEHAVTFMDAADRILLVTTPEMAALRDVRRFMHIGQSLAYDLEKLLIVLNRENLPGSISTKDIETTLRRRVFARIPEDSPNMMRSLNRGIPLIMKYPRSAASRAIKQLAITLGEMKEVDLVRVPITQSINKAQREALLASAQFG